MDCLAARKLLDLASPLRTAEPDEAAAADHVAQCAECQAIVQARRRFDQQVGEVCRTVPVPSGLKARILAGLAEASLKTAPGQMLPAEEFSGEDATQGEPAPVSSEPLRRGRVEPRRNWLRRVGAVSVVALLALALGSAWWWNQPRPIPLELVVAEVLDPELAHAALPPLTAFANGLQPTPPQAIPLGDVVTVPPRRLIVADREVAVWFLTVQSSRRRPLPTRLAVVPSSSITVPVTGAPGTRGRWSVRAWPEADVWYILAVDGPEQELRRLIPTRTL